MRDLASISDSILASISRGASQPESRLTDLLFDIFESWEALRGIKGN